MAARYFSPILRAVFDKSLPVRVGIGIEKELSPAGESKERGA
jgi:hypothetical protein